MTYRDKLVSLHPDWSMYEVETYMVDNCPILIDSYANDPTYCVGRNVDLCVKCWCRKVPTDLSENTPIVIPNVNAKITPDYLKLIDDICDMNCKLKAAGFSHEESFWIIKSMVERMP